MKAKKLEALRARLNLSRRCGLGSTSPCQTGDLPSRVSRPQSGNWLETESSTSSRTETDMALIGDIRVVHQGNSSWAVPCPQQQTNHSKNAYRLSQVDGNLRPISLSMSFRKGSFVDRAISTYGQERLRFCGESYSHCSSRVSRMPFATRPARRSAPSQVK